MFQKIETFLEVFMFRFSTAIILLLTVLSTATFAGFFNAYVSLFIVFMHVLLQYYFFYSRPKTVFTKMMIEKQRNIIPLTSEQAANLKGNVEKTDGGERYS